MKKISLCFFVQLFLALVTLCNLHSKLSSISYLPSSKLTSTSTGNFNLPVRACDYCDFLNQTAAANSDFSYTEKMGNDSTVACITRRGTPGNVHYEVIAGRESSPVTFINENDADAYSRWLGKKVIVDSIPNDQEISTCYSLLVTHSSTFIGNGSCSLALSPIAHRLFSDHWKEIAWGAAVFLTVGMVEENRFLAENPESTEHEASSSSTQELPKNDEDKENASDRSTLRERPNCWFEDPDIFPQEKKVPHDQEQIPFEETAAYQIALNNNKGCILTKSMLLEAKIRYENAESSFTEKAANLATLTEDKPKSENTFTLGVWSPSKKVRETAAQAKAAAEETEKKVILATTQLKNAKKELDSAKEELAKTQYFYLLDLAQRLDSLQWQLLQQLHFWTLGKDAYFPLNIHTREDVDETINLLIKTAKEFETLWHNNLPGISGEKEKLRYASLSSEEKTAELYLIAGIQGPTFSPKEESFIENNILELLNECRSTRKLEEIIKQDQQKKYGCVKTYEEYLWMMKNKLREFCPNSIYTGERHAIEKRLTHYLLQEKKMRASWITYLFETFTHKAEAETTLDTQPSEYSFTLDNCNETSKKLTTLKEAEQLTQSTRERLNLIALPSLEQKQEKLPSINFTDLLETLSPTKLKENEALGLSNSNEAIFDRYQYEQELSRIWTKQIIDEIKSDRTLMPLKISLESFFSEENEKTLTTQESF